MMDRFIYSSAVDHLSADEKSTYSNNVKSIGLLVDPYCIPDVKFVRWSEEDVVTNVGRWPPLGYMDIYNYLINSSSQFTGLALKSYKGLDAYKYFVAGWVHDLRICKLSDISKDNGNKCSLVMAKVRHSQSVSETPLRPWIILADDGSIVTGHCNCMAGLARSCSHLAAALFAIDAVVQRLSSTSCTSMPSLWVQPSAIPVTFASAASIVFKKPEAKLKSGASLSHTVPYVNIKPLSSCSQLYAAMASTGDEPVALSLVPDYCNIYQPESSKIKLPQPLQQLFDSRNTGLKYSDLVEKSLAVLPAMQLTAEQIRNVELSTRGQYHSKLWQTHRAGRITASNAKAAITTDITNPSRSIIVKICYPEAAKFSNIYTRWGCTHENDGRQRYERESQHSNLVVSECGLFICDSAPYIAATPDGTITCSCCEPGLLEVKCPFCQKGKAMADAAEDKNFCLVKTANGLQLKRDHSYYYQVQMQLYATKLAYADFVVWTGDDSQQLHVERIYPDQLLLSEILPKLEKFFIEVIGPELLARWFSDKPLRDAQLYVTNTSACGSSTATSSCYCGGPEEDPMVLCSNADCQRGRFHLKCVGRKVMPSSKAPFVCVECRAAKKCSKK